MFKSNGISVVYADIIARAAIREGIGAWKRKKDWDWKTKVVLSRKCRPMMELFRCDDLVKRKYEDDEGDKILLETDGDFVVLVNYARSIGVKVNMCMLLLALSFGD
ncbi:hypothetical protein K1719_002002 [Acacia pycnantha]|nr:hypothetical protein K1719_002002 [Acacia pycnantha]